jgi:hypothetical protein
MLIRLKTWDEKRHLFSEEEKAVLNANITGQVICPQGLTVKVNGDTRPLLIKLGLKPGEEDDE